MFTPLDRPADAAGNHRLLLEQATALWEAGLPLWSNLANLAALLKASLPDTNWAGFYLWQPEREELVVGPFQGLPACTRIPAGRGVCGTAVSTRQTQLVADVHQFPGHIACDAASQSEIVVPILAADGSVRGVIDIDSPLIGRFDREDQVGLETLARFVSAHWTAP